MAAARVALVTGAMNMCDRGEGESRDAEKHTGFDRVKRKANY